MASMMREPSAHAGVSVVDAHADDDPFDIFDDVVLDADIVELEPDETDF